MKKKGIVIFACVLFLGAALSGAAGYAIGQNEVIATVANHIKVTSEGREIDTGGDVPLVYNNKTYLPVRAVSESLGYEVEWMAESNTVNLSMPDSAYPIIALDGNEIIDALPSLNLMSNTAIQTVTVIVDQTEEFDHAPILVLEVLKNGVVIDSQTKELEKSPGKYSVDISSSQFSHQLGRDLTSDERLDKYNEQFSYGASRGRRRIDGAIVLAGRGKGHVGRRGAGWEPRRWFRWRFRRSFRPDAGPVSK